MRLSFQTKQNKREPTFPLLCLPYPGEVWEGGFSQVPSSWTATPQHLPQLSSCLLDDSLLMFRVLLSLNASSIKPAPYGSCSITKTVPSALLPSMSPKEQADSMDG